jgi:SWIB/MDM2 domain
MEEVVTAFFTYIHDKKLTSETDASVVVADKLLQDLLGMEYFPFSQLQQLLFTRYLIEPINYEDPIRIVYIMETATASVLGEPGGDTLQFDMDCIVPSLLPVRLRELLRRVKRRETDYSNSRSKARYLIPHDTRDDRRLREAIDTAVTRTEINADLVPLHLALAMAAPDGSEARATSRRDAQLCYLMGQLQDRVPAAAKVRARYEVLQEMVDEAMKC